MDSFDFKREKLEDMRQDMKEEQYKRQRMSEDLEYALEECGLFNVSEAIERLKNNLEYYELEVDKKTLTEAIGDLI